MIFGQFFNDCFHDSRTTNRKRHMTKKSWMNLVFIKQTFSNFFNFSLKTFEQFFCELNENLRNIYLHCFSTFWILWNDVWFWSKKSGFKVYKIAWSYSNFVYWFIFIKSFKIFQFSWLKITSNFETFIICFFLHALLSFQTPRTCNI